MYPEALQNLTCPLHPAERLTLEQQVYLDSDGAVLHGWLCCPACNRRYHIRDGIADLLGWRAFPNSPAQLVNYLPPAAWAYERLWRPYSLHLLAGEPFGYDRELPLITSLTAPERGGVYLDIACSNGLYARSMARRLEGQQGHVVGIDHSLPMLQQAHAYARRSGLRISFVRARAQALPFAAETVAGAAMGGSLNEIGDVVACLRETRRVLALDGRFAMMHLARAESRAGRLLQRFLSTGGIVFRPLAAQNCQFAEHGLRLVAQWRYRVVVFSLLLPCR
jgi:SAM-dependent methyltransferase